MTVVKAGPHIIRVPSVPIRYADDDEYALSYCHSKNRRRLGLRHHACAFLDFLSDPSSKYRIVPDAEAYASLAKLALQLGDPNCTAIFVPVKNIMMPNDGTAEEGLRLLINKELPLRR